MPPTPPTPPTPANVHHPGAQRPTYAPPSSGSPAYLPLPSAHAVVAAGQALPRMTDGKQRMWPALLTLYLLAPAVGEMLSGSTPPVQFINPFSLLYQAGLYGSGAILVRELVRRRGLGWSSILLLGAAYGILEEGLVVTSWFNPDWPDVISLHGFSRALDTNWFWALSLTAYHAVVSITTPIILTESLFPRLADRPWLRRRGMRFFSIWLGVISLIGLLGFGFLAFRKQGYTHPPAMYAVALVLAIVCVWLGLRLRPAAPRWPISSPAHRPAPRLWLLRLAGLAATILFFAISWAGPGITHSPAVAIGLLTGLIVLCEWRVHRWSTRAHWGAEQRLALVSGVMGFFLLLAPLVEFAARPAGKNTTGMTLVAFLWLAGLIWLAHRAGRQRIETNVQKSPILVDNAG